MTQTTDTAFKKALALHGAGRIDEAWKLYEEILTQDARHFKSLHHLGIAALQQGQYLAALDYIDRSLAIEQSQALAHNSRAVVLRALKRDDEALAAYDSAIALAPQQIKFRLERARLLLDLRRLGQVLRERRQLGRRHQRRRMRGSMNAYIRSTSRFTARKSAALTSTTPCTIG